MPERTCIVIRDRHGFQRTVAVQDTMVFGRHAQCDVVLADGMVSRTHLRVQRGPEGWWVEDLGSSHGTFQQDQRLTRLLWIPGSTLRVADGAYFLTLQAESGAAAASASSEVNLQALLQTATLLTGEVELDELLERTLDRLLTLSGTDRGFIMLPEQGELVVKVQRNLGAVPVSAAIQLSMSSVAKVFEQGEPVWIRNVAQDERLRAQQSVVDLKIKTILCLPMQVQGERIGVLYLDSQRAATEPVDRASFEAIVALCAIAIERTRLAEQSLHNQVLATVGKVASSIIHDFKNGLFVIGGHAQLLGLVAKDANSSHHLAQILGAVDRLQQLSMDILDYSRIRESRCEPVDLAGYLAAQAEPFQLRAQESEVTLICQGVPCQASLDRHRFGRVIENLLANALDALSGQVGGQVQLRWAPLAPGVEIQVTDNGKGIPRKILKRIFEPFFSYGKAKGTGLGMATVKRIMEEHGGTVAVASEEGRGTTVTLHLPGVQGDRAPDVDTAEYQLGPGGRP